MDIKKEIEEKGWTVAEIQDRWQLPDLTDISGQLLIDAVRGLPVRLKIQNNIAGHKTVML